jgi:hypothetical protein
MVIRIGKDRFVICSPFTSESVGPGGYRSLFLFVGLKHHAPPAHTRGAETRLSSTENGYELTENGYELMSPVGTCKTPPPDCVANPLLLLLLANLRKLFSP